MITFLFRVNPSFLQYQNHPVTIPKECYDQLRNDGCANGNDKPGHKIAVTITAPSGRNYEGWIYYGRSGWDLYYQIKVKAIDARDYCGRLTAGDQIPVAIKKFGNAVQARFFESADPTELLNCFAAMAPHERVCVLAELKKAQVKESA